MKRQGIRNVADEPAFGKGYEINLKPRPRYDKIQDVVRMKGNGSSIKYIRSDCVILDSFHPCNCTFAFSLHSLLPSASVRTLFSKEDMTEIYSVNLYQSKNQKRYKIKKLLYKAVGKCQIKRQRRALGSILHFLTARE